MRSLLLAVAALATVAENSSAQVARGSPQDKALATIVEALDKKVGKNALHHTASFALEDWPASVRLARMERDETPILLEPSLQPSTLTVVAIVRTGELLQVLEERRITQLINPLSRIPDHSGIWARVRLKSGETGWLFAVPKARRDMQFATIVNRPSPGILNGDLPGPILLVTAIGIGLFFARWLSRQGGGVGATGGGASAATSARSASRRSTSRVEAYKARDYEERTSLATQLLGKTPSEKIEEKFGKGSFVDSEGRIRGGGLLRQEKGHIDPQTGQIVDTRGILRKDRGYIDDKGDVH